MLFVDVLLQCYNVVKFGRIRNVTFVSDVICKTNFTLKHFFQIIFLNLEMDSSDEDFLPDPNRPWKRKRPPDHGKASGSGQRRKLDEQDNKQSGPYLHDDFTKGKCFFIYFK